jgi:hypothetical protein
MVTQHDELFEQYINELRAVKVLAERWWVSMLESEERVTGDVGAALKAVKERWPSGPASHPRVIAVIRKFFLACEALNRAIAARTEKAETITAESVLPHTIAVGVMEEVGRPDEEFEEDGEIQPGHLLAGRLLSSQTEDLAEFVVRLRYWPIGEDETF